MHSVPFTQQTKRAITVVKLSEDMARVWIKGAPSAVILYCKTYVCQNGMGEIMTPDVERLLQEDVINKAMH